ncbi:MAG: ABC transporter substrate-binding protein [Erysipelotrichaceae bacterium]|nr:ABC transporter substrate-binding protein [Erysipelotrichaceae bacterium]
MKKLLVVLLSVFVVFGLVGCSGGSGGDEASPTIKLGGSGPLTGGAAVYGNDVFHAAELAVKEINEAEGFDFFDFKFEDDEADPEKAPNAYGVLKDWGMQVSIYTTTSGAGLAVVEDYFNDRIFAITPSGSNPGLVYNGSTNYDNCFQVCFTDPNQGVASADYIKNNALGEKVAIIYRSDDDYSTTVYQKFKDEAAKVGLDIVYEGSFIDTDSDYSAQLTAAQNAGADVVFLPIYYTPAAGILTQADAMGYAPVFFGIDGMDGILTLEGFDTALAEGVYLLTPFAADATDDKTVHFVTAFKEAYGGTPTQFGADAYDAVYAIYEACKAAGVDGTNSTEEICDALIGQFTSMTFDGLTGKATWAANGEVSKSPKAVIIENGVYVAAE